MINKNIVQQPKKTLQNTNNQLQNELKFQDIQVKKKILQLNNFIQQVERTFQDKVLFNIIEYKDLANLDRLIEEADYDIPIEKYNPNISQQLDNSKETVKISQKSENFQEKKKENTVTQTTEDLAKLLNSMYGLLEKNIHESQVLKVNVSELVVAEKFQSRRLSQSLILVGDLDEELQESNRLKDIEVIESEESFSEDEDSEDQQDQVQIQRLLSKIEELHQNVLDLQTSNFKLSQIKNSTQQQLLRSTCTSQLDYFDTNIDFQQQPFEWQTAYSSILGNVININKELGDSMQQNIKCLPISSIKDIFYPYKNERIIAIVYQNDEGVIDLLEFSSNYNPITLISGLQKPKLIEYGRGQKLISLLRVFLIRLSSDEDMDKWDLNLWALCRRQMAYSQRHVFDNEMFERPFYDENNVYDFINPEFDLLREIVKGMIDHKDPQIIQMKTKEFEKTQLLFGQIIQNAQQVPNGPKSPVIILPIPTPPLKTFNTITTQQMHQTQNLTRQNTPSPIFPLPIRSTMIQASQNDQIKINKANTILKQGFCFIKYSSSQYKPNQRVVYLCDNEKLLRWKEPLQPFDRSQNTKKKQTKEERTINLETVTQVKDHADGPGFKKFKKQREGKEHLAITIIAERNLEIEAATQEDKNLFIECLNLALLNVKKKKDFLQ